MDYSNDFFESFKAKPHIEPKILVVHCKKDLYDIYIGRLPGDKYNKWAYPRELRDKFPKGTPRKVIIDAYEDYLLSNPKLMAELCELKDKKISCWCKNKMTDEEIQKGKQPGGKSCHGDILAKWCKKTCY